MRLLNVAVVAAGLVAGCANLPGMPGHISETRSTFDDSTQLSMEPAFVFRGNDGFSGSDLQLALHWRSSMKPGALVLEASVDGAESIATANSLHFRIDGEVVSFTSIDQLTDIRYEPGVYGPAVVPGGNVSSKRYLITWDFLDKIITAKDVRVKLDLRKTFVEGVFSDSTTSAARPSFIEFAKAAEKYRK